MDAGLLSVNVTLFSSIATNSLSNILCYIYVDLDVRFKQSLLLLTSFTSILFLKFSIVFPYTALFINLDNLFPSLSPFFSASIFLCVEFNIWF